MAREKYVTRTVKKTVAVVACANKLTMTIENITLEIPEKVIDEFKILKIAKKKIDSGMYAPVSVVDVNYEDTVMGITMDVFMENAVEMNR